MPNCFRDFYTHIYISRERKIVRGEAAAAGLRRQAAGKDIFSGLEKFQ